MSDSEFLAWLHDRLVMVHGENENVDYMHKLRSIIVKINVTPQKAQVQTNSERDAA